MLRLVQSHAAELLRFARRFSHCADDAHDAYQRTLEILVRRMRVDPPAQPVSWVRTVLRHEALAVRVQREQLVGRFEVDFDRHEGRHLEDPAERAVGHEQLSHAAEALQRLKPQEVTALVLRAEGLTYKQICARTGWTYTRCNRVVTEGRRALAERLGAIESGAECDRWLPVLSALADGEATFSERSELRPHLRRCAGCRATLRTYHAAPAQVAALVPAAAIPLTADSGGSLLGQAELALHALAERVTLVAMRVQGAFEGVSGAKVAAVAASTGAAAGGGAAIERATQAADPPSRAGAATVVTAASAPGGAVVMPASITDPLPLAAPARSRRDRQARRLEFAPGARGSAASEFAGDSGTAGEFTAASAGDEPADGGGSSSATAAAATSPRPQFSPARSAPAVSAPAGSPSGRDASTAPAGQAEFAGP